MLILGTTATLVRITPGTAGQIASSYSYVDDLTTGPTFTPGGAQNADLATTTTTTVVPAPAANTQRNVKGIVIANESVAVNTTMLVEQFDGTNTVPLWKGTLLTGERIILDEVGQWTYYAADGTVKISTAPGSYIGTTILTASGNFTTSVNTRTIRIRGQAPGGGGGGANTAATSDAVGGGGSAGGYVEKTFAGVQPSTAYAFTIGAVGAAGAAAAGTGGTAGNITFVVSGTTVTAFGGIGGVGMSGAATPLTVSGGASPAVSTNGDLNTTGNPGLPGERQSATISLSGAGGSGTLGPGGISRVAQSAGAAPVGFGGGGSGGSCINGGAAAAGGAGAPGVWIVQEFT